MAPSYANNTTKAMMLVFCPPINCVVLSLYHMSSEHSETKGGLGLPENARGPKSETIFGPPPECLRALAFSDINVITQVRKDFDEVRLSELIDSIRHHVADGTVQYVLIYPLLVNRIHPGNINQYMADHQSFNNLAESELANLKMAADGYYYVLCDGGRRMRAIGRIIEQDKLDPAYVEVVVLLEEDLEFLTANRSQMSGNAHHRTSAIEEAENIRRYYNFMKTKYPNITLSHTDIAKATGRSSDFVADALIFTSLPPQVQSLARKRELTYERKGRMKTRVSAPLPFGVVIKFKQIELALRKKNADSANEPGFDEKITIRLMAIALRLVKIRLSTDFSNKSSEQRTAFTNAYINGHINNIASPSNIEGGLFGCEQEPANSIAIEDFGIRHISPETMLKRAVRAMVKNILLLLQLISESNGAAKDPEVRAMLGEVARQAATMAGEQPMDHK